MRTVEIVYKDEIDDNTITPANGMHQSYTPKYMHSLIMSSDKSLIKFDNLIEKINCEKYLKIIGYVSEQFSDVNLGLYVINPKDLTIETIKDAPYNAIVYTCENIIDILNEWEKGN